MTTAKSHLIKTLESVQAENKDLRSKLGKPAPEADTVTLTPPQKLEAARLENDRLKSEVAANTPPPPPQKPEKPVSKLKQIEARFKSDNPPRGEELESICKDLLGEMEKRL